MFNKFSSYEDEFQHWVSGGYPDAKTETLDYIRHLSDPEDDARPREGTLWPHQWDSFLRVVYSYEVRREEIALPDGVLLNVVTGGGKTAIIAALIAWLRLAHDVQKFVMLCPQPHRAGSVGRGLSGRESVRRPQPLTARRFCEKG